MLFALIAGMGTAITPCVLPVLPALLSASALGGRRRPVGIVLGLGATFTIAIVLLAAGAVLCVQGGETPRDAVLRARDKLARSGVRVLGVVINNLDEEAGGYSKRYADDETYYGEAETAEEQAGGVATATRLI